MFFIDASTGTAVGSGGTILHTTNGGVNWTIQSSGTTNTLWSVCSTDANTGTVVGISGTILHTTTGGVVTGLPDPERTSQIPNQFVLEQNYPNPFNPITRIELGIKNSEFLVLKVYDVLGREVATLLSETRSPGTYTLDFDGRGLASGVYMYRLTAGGIVASKRMLLVK